MTYQEIFRSSDKGNYGHSWTNDRNSLKGIIMLLKTRKASLQHELVCNKTMTAYDEVILIVALDTVNSL